jgi:hypothetical protein
MPQQGPPFAGPNPSHMQHRNFDNRPRQQNVQGNRPRGAPQRQRQEEVKLKKDATPQPDEKSIEEFQKQPKVTCFNCVEWGHFNIDCKAPKLYFIYQTTDHVGKNCPEWEKPMESALYLESVAQGLGFFHVEVQENEER